MRSARSGSAAAIRRRGAAVGRRTVELSGRAKSRLIGFVARRAVAWQTARGRSPLALLPASVTMPLRRNGLDPLPELAAMREKAPVNKLPLPFGVNVWLVTGYEEAKQVLADTERFSNDFANIAADPSLAAAIGGNADEKDPGGLGMADPPDHTRLRKILTPEFTMRRLSRLTPMLEAIVEGQLDAIAADAASKGGGGPVDLVELFSLPIPSLAICELLGVPYADRDAFQRLSVARFDLFAGAGASLGAISESLDYLMGVVAQQRKDPGDGLLGMIIREHGDAIDDRELAGLADGILVGGFETTASMIALGALVLLQDHTTRDLIRTDPDAIGPFVEELLRYLTVVQVAFPRFAREDCEVAGVRIGAGDVVLVSLSGADRDPALTDGEGNLDLVDPQRAPTKHLAFGYGAHRCIGAELAKMELRIAYPALVRRFPTARLAVDPSDLKYRQTSIVYGVEKLPVILG
nr:cytochrome P450 [Nakamurella lactea]